MAHALRTLLRITDTQGPVLVVLQAPTGPDGEGPADIVIVRQHALLVGILRDYRGPIRVSTEEAWLFQETGAPIQEAGGLTPLEFVQRQRDAICEELEPFLSPPPDCTKLVAAVICAPALHPASLVSLDVDDHRRGLKVLGLDELPGLTTMLRASLQLTPEQIERIATEFFGARLWYDDTQTLFELTPAAFRLRVLEPRPGQAELLELVEGETIIGRRRTPRRDEPRISISSDDLISSDHAQLFCDDSDVVLVRDMSKNGTRLSIPGGEDLMLRSAERAVPPDTILTLGVTRLRLERTQ